MTELSAATIAKDKDDANHLPRLWKRLMAISGATIALREASSTEAIDDCPAVSGDQLEGAFNCIVDQIELAFEDFNAHENQLAHLGLHPFGPSLVPDGWSISSASAKPRAGVEASSVQMDAR